MKQYFDSTFFKFFFGFLAILFLSLVILFALRVWTVKHEAPAGSPDPTINVTYNATP